MPETNDIAERLRQAASLPEVLAAGGREALTIAPSLPLDGGTSTGVAMPTGPDAGQTADALAALAAVLRDRLTDAATQADLPGDRAACQDAAAAAGQICQLMTR